MSTKILYYAVDTTFWHVHPAMAVESITGFNTIVVLNIHTFYVPSGSARMLIQGMNPVLTAQK